MLRTLPFALMGLMLAGIVHLVTVLLLPRLAPLDGYDRVASALTPHQVTPLARAVPGAAPVPFLDPAFAHAVCRFDLADGPVRLVVPVSPSYTSVSFYTQDALPFYAISDRAAGRRSIELTLLTARQRAELPTDEDETAADQLLVVSPSSRGMVLLRALAVEPSAFAEAERALAQARCETIR